MRPSRFFFLVTIAFASQVNFFSLNAAEPLVEYGTQPTKHLLDFFIPDTANGCTAIDLTPGEGYEKEPTRLESNSEGKGIVVTLAAPGTGEISADNAVMDGHYLQFALNAESGKLLDLAELSVKVWSGSNGKRKFSAYITPIGGGTNKVSSVVIEGAEVPTTGQMKEDPNLATVTADLASMEELQGLEGVDVKLIFHGFGSNPNGDAGGSGSCIDAIALTGSVRNK